MLITDKLFIRYCQGQHQQNHLPRCISTIIYLLAIGTYCYETLLLYGMIIDEERVAHEFTMAIPAELHGFS